MTFALGRLSRYGGGWVVAGWLVLLTGCATPRIDWQARVGHYTYDQAILELGPPEKSATLTDGSVVADWLTQRGSDDFGLRGRELPALPQRRGRHGRRQFDRHQHAGLSVAAQV